MPRRSKAKTRKTTYRFLWRPQNAVVDVDLHNVITTAAFNVMSPLDLARSFVTAASKCLGPVEGQDFHITQDHLFPGGIVATGPAGIVFLE